MDGQVSLTATITKDDVIYSVAATMMMMTVAPPNVKIAQYLATAAAATAAAVDE